MIKNIEDSILEIISKCDFEVKTLEEISVSVLTGNLPKVVNQKVGNTPVIKTGDINGLKSPFIHECKTFLDGSNIKNKSVVKRGDILIIYNSSPKIIGKTFLYLGEEECIVGPNICLIKHRQDSNYLLHVLNSPSVQKQIKFAANNKRTRNSLCHIQPEDLGKISVPIPSIETQTKIANYLNNLLFNKIQLENDLERMIWREW